MDAQVPYRKWCSIVGPPHPQLVEFTGVEPVAMVGLLRMAGPVPSTAILLVNIEDELSFHLPL